MRSPEILLDVSILQTHFFTKRGVVQAVNGVSFSVGAGERMAVVGESGSGKSVMTMSLMRLVAPPGRIVGGAIRFDGRDMLALSERDLNAVRGRDMAMVFQDPMTSLNPVLTIEAQMI